MGKPWTAAPPLADRVLSVPVDAVGLVKHALGEPVTRAYRFALDPTSRQIRDLERHAGAARFAFNWALAAVKSNLDQREAERSYGLTGERLTPALGWNLPALRRAWNQAKDKVAPWWSECSKESYNTGLDRAARALKNWADSISGARKGAKQGFPRFKARRRTTPSARFTTGTIRAESDRRHVVLPRIGRIKTHESTRALVRRIEAGTARILSATVRRECGRWYCAFTVQVQCQVRTPFRPKDIVGVDLGIAKLVVLSTGAVFPDPRHLDKSLRSMRRAARELSRRQGPDSRTGRHPSKRWESTRREVARLHARIANQRKDSLHKLTTTLTRTYGTVVVEDLNVAGMLHNKRLARHLADAGFGEIRHQLEYKTKWSGGTLIVADRWFPSSKTCSTCGLAKPKLSLRSRIFVCESCGLNLDRDLNAAINLKHYVARSGRETLNGRGADQKTRPSRAGGCETSIPHQATGQDGNRSLVTASCESARDHAR